MMRILDDTVELAGKKVLLRADIDVAINDGHIGEAYRVQQQRATLDFLRSKGAQVLVVGHMGDGASIESLVSEISGILNMPLVFCKDVAAAADFWAGSSPVGILENVRAWPGEEANDEAFALQLAAGCDLYVNNAFAVCHRAHASVVALAKLLPAYAGLLVKEETVHLKAVTDAPAKGKIVYMGGAKASTKVPVIKYMLNTAERVAIGGVLANDIAKELGQDVGVSRVDADAHELLAGLDLSDARLVLPTDSVIDQGQIMDIGPQSAQAFAALAASATLIIWNGPMGKFEDERFMASTKTIAQAIAASSATKVIGGGDTVAAIDQLGLREQMGFVSTGGGAMLAFLAGQRLPALEALGYYD